MLEKIAKEILLFRSEYFVTTLYLVLAILSYKYVGFYCVRDIIFNIIITCILPACFIAVRLTRRMLYNVYFGDDNEN